MKGGIGKSSATVMAATALSTAPFNKKVLVLDLDRQGSLIQLRELDAEDTEDFNYDIVQCSVDDFFNSVEELDKTYDYVFLEVAGKIDNNLPVEQQEITPILLNTDILVIPFVAGNFGAGATLQYLEYIINVQELKKKKQQRLSVVGFVNMHFKQRKEDRSFADFLETIAAETGLRFMQNKLGFYTAYRGANTIDSLYKDSPDTNQERNFKMWIKELSKLLENVL